MALCEWDGDDCSGEATTSIDGYQYRPMAACAACKAAYDKWLANYDPPDADGEDLFRDYQAEARDQMDEARRLK